MQARRLVPLGAVLGLWLGWAVGGADARAQLAFDPQWRQGHAVDWVGAGLGLGTAALVAWTVPTDEPRWVGAGPADALFLTAPSPARRRRLALTSDLLGLLTLAPLVVDPIVAAHADGALGREVALVELRSLALTSLLVAVTKYGVRRRRPRCAAPRAPTDAALDPTLGPEPTAEASRCPRPSDHRSFVSGHAAFSWTAAATLCTVHRHLGLYRSRAADWAACGIAASLATVTAALRVAAQRHYLSDVVVGALVGLLSGWVLPALATFGFGDP